MRRNLLPGAVLLGLAAALAACSNLTQPAAPPPAAAIPEATVPGAPPAAPVVISAGDLVGSWGLTSFTTDAGYEKALAEGRNACSNPYVIAAGANGGVMMYLADQSVASEVFIKTGGGRVFIGPHGQPGDRRDREITSASGGVVIMKWVDPSVAKRYGTMIFVRCGA